VWLEPYEWLGSAVAQRYPLHLISNQPAARLHSQLDHGSTSVAAKIQGREPLRMHPLDATDRGLGGGEIVRVFNDRGACLAGLVLSEELRRGVVQLATGAWYCPSDPNVARSLELNGNPNVLTRDRGSSPLAQAPTAQTTLVEVERWEGEAPAVTVFEPPVFVQP
jgi:biotin/methionine sulfoxide reductase